MPKGAITGVAVYPQTTTYPGTVRVDFSVTNTGSGTYTFAVGISIGNQSKGVWYDVGYFNDGKTGTCVPAGEPTSGYVCMTLGPGQSGTGYRTLTIPNDPDVKDVWAAVKDPANFYTPPDYGVLDSDIRYNAITVPVTVGASISISNVS